MHSSRPRIRSLRRNLPQTNGAVIAALESYQQWLKSDLLPQSHGDFRLGAATYSKKLALDEMVDTPLPKLLEIAYADLHKNQAEFYRIAKEVDPNKQPRQVLDELTHDHPAPDQLLQSFRDTFTGLIQFIQEKQIVDIPSPVAPSSKRRRPSCAPPRSPPWTRRVPLKRWPKRPTST